MSFQNRNQEMFLLSINFGEPSQFKENDEDWHNMFCKGSVPKK